MTEFEIISLIVNGVLTLATLGAAAVAWTMAIAAGRDKTSAENARDAAVKAQKEAAAALAAANAIAQEALEAQRLALPAAWGNPQREPGGNSYSLRNNSGRTMIVNQLEAVAGGNIYVLVPPTLPTRVENGDVIRFTAQLGGTTSVSGNAVEIRWLYEGELDPDTITVRRL